ncbi:hypothetical protein [Agrococcus casei]|uniref:hypothetical protein n=1 Tax=Agrococcus casei TaxID=343512 RepID=UPI003F905327
MTSEARFPASAADWANTSSDRERAKRIGLVDALAAREYPSLLKRMGEEGAYVEHLRRRFRVGAVRSFVEYTIMLVAVLGAGALFSGRTLRIEYDFDAAIALPVASAGMVVAAAGLIALHVLWLRPAAARSAEGVTAAVITAIAGVVAAVLVPIKAADWSMSDWHVHFGIVIGCALIGAVSAVVQSVTGVGSAKVPSDASMHDAIALQWQKLPERARLQLLTDRNDALDILVDRGFISESKASAHRERLFGSASSPIP